MCPYVLLVRQRLEVSRVHAAEMTVLAGVVNPHLIRDATVERFVDSSMPRGRATVTPDDRVAVRQPEALPQQTAVCTGFAVAERVGQELSIRALDGLRRATTAVPHVMAEDESPTGVGLSSTAAFAGLGEVD